MMRTEVVVKNAESILEIGRELKVPMPIQGITHAYYQYSQASGLNDLPWDEMIKLWMNLIGKPIRF